jgi:hypothetical protein
MDNLRAVSIMLLIFILRRCSLARSLALVFGALSYSSPLAKSDRTSGVDVSKPVRFSVFESVGSAIVRSLLTIPTTTSFASIPVAERYCCRATWGCTEPK